MIDHLSLRVSDFDKSLAFYQAALAPLGYRVLMQFPGMAGLGVDMPDFWVTHSANAINPTHLAFSAERAAIHAFHEAALAAGGRDNGAPGLRPDYHAHYYGAFVLDPDGHVIQAEPHAPEAVKAAANKP